MAFREPAGAAPPSRDRPSTKTASDAGETKRGAVELAISSLRELARYAPFMKGGQVGADALDALDRKDAAVAALQSLIAEAEA